MRVLILAVIGAVLGLGATNVYAQHGHHSQHGHHVQHGHGYHVDRHSHSIRDSHGHVIGQYGHDVIGHNSTYILPHTGGSHHGTYCVRNGQPYYYPQTVHASSTYGSRYQPQPIQFGGFAHIDDLAARLGTLANEFCLELHHNYSHNPNFQETYREAYQILQTAHSIHAAEHRQDRQAIQNQLGSLDQLFHHVENKVRGWSRHQHQQVGQLGTLSKMDLIQTTLHHLMNDAGVKPTPIPPAVQPPPSTTAAPSQTSPPPPPPVGSFPPPTAQ